MASSVFERTRALHADVEEMKEQLLNSINKHASTPKDRILLDHELKHQLDELCACQAKLLELYEDRDGVRSSELRAMTGGGSGGGANETLWTNFYDSLSQIRMYHAKFPNAARIGTGSSSSSAAAAAAAAAAAEGEVDASDAAEALVSGGASSGVQFSAEESFGSRVDMNALYERYINLPQFSRHTDYLTFLAEFPRLGQKVPRDKKLKAQPHEYRKFVQALLDYLIDFHKRIRPLADTDVLRDMIRQDFEQQWNNKAVAGWFDEATAAAASAAAAAAAEHEPGSAAAAAAAASAAAATPAAASAAASSDASAAAPAAAVGGADASNPLYCVACAKLFAKDSVFAAHLPGKKHKKNEEIRLALSGGAASSASSSSAAAVAVDADANASKEGEPNNGVAPAAAAAAASSAVSKLNAEFRSLALLEVEVAAFADLLSDALEGTRQYLVKKQTRTYEELQAEMAATAAEVLRAKLALKGGGTAAAEEEEEEETDANAPLYNPLNLPLGFDGKPIPYWLYKLHGLNLKFDCEICGNFSYAGPRNFERHFTEWRHAYGMRALGIPNTKHFAHITKIADAQALFDKLKKEGVGAGFKADEEEEYEDKEGNVFNKRTYMELQKQGLV